MAAEQKPLHILTEALGSISGIFLLSICNKVPEYKTILCTIGLTTLLIDIYFLTTWR